ncbi:MlaD family protein [Primorskyibacter aestuariivivens]|uniref:PqiB family protein n=1 Tax=Primorskyibacter aestuariivivens TaxID=1888912 RepID=UPI0023000A99|nr:MlaD family protein [Primorskyibacter aestuariivivens]MDA7427603.1 MlaD family protein [Primorskyibacter aestuariivivens]
MTDPTPADPVVRPAHGVSSPRFSVIWMVPILALAISLGIAWKSYAERGVRIVIGFDNATGIVAEKTELKYRDVTVGLVEEVGFSDDLSEVLVAVRLDRELAPYLDADAQFWVVRPEVSAQGISGLNTVLSGVYIEGRWDSQANEVQTRFTGLSRAPLSDAAGGGIAIRLSARDGNSIIAGAPILYKGIPVGKVEAPELSETGDSVIIRGFIDAPYDQIVTENTRFWDISGVSLSLGAGGVSLDFSSIASLVQGGIGFDTLITGGARPAEGHLFPLYTDQETARASLLDDPTTERLRVLAVFDGSVGGLKEDATVRFRGVQVGEVESVAMIASDMGGRSAVRLHATLAITPARMGLGEEAGTEDALDFLASYVEQGLRVRLATASLLSNELVVDLVEVPDADPARIITRQDALPELPTVEADIADLNASAEGVFKRINNLPIEELLASLQGLIDSANLLIVDEDTQAIAPGINATLEELRALSPDLTRTMAETEATLKEVRLIAAELRENGATENVNNVFNSASSAADAIEAAAGELPKLTARLNALATRTETVLKTYDDNSRLISGALSTLRDISEAADALRSLARTIQRDPSSLVTGR